MADTTTNQKYVETGKKRTERRIQHQGMGAGCQCSMSASKGAREVAMYQIIDDCLIFLAMAHIAVAKIWQRWP